MLIDLLVKRYSAMTEIIGLQAVPLQFIFDEEMISESKDAEFLKSVGFKDLNQDKDQAQLKLEKQWKKLGFKKLCENYMFKRI